MCCNIILKKCCDMLGYFIGTTITLGAITTTTSSILHFENKLDDIKFIIIPAGITVGSIALCILRSICLTRNKNQNVLKNKSNQMIIINLNDISSEAGKDKKDDIHTAIVIEDHSNNLQKKLSNNKVIL